MLYDPKWKQFEVTSPVADMLISARELIANPKKWCGRGPGHSGENCAATAIWIADKIARGISYFEYAIPSNVAERAYKLLARTMGVEQVPEFNDVHTHSEVMAMFDKAIETAQSRRD